MIYTYIHTFNQRNDIIIIDISKQISEILTILLLLSLIATLTILQKYFCSIVMVASLMTTVNDSLVIEASRMQCALHYALQRNETQRLMM